MPNQINMDLKTIGKLVSILVVFVGVIWFFATQNSKIDHAVGSLEAAKTKIERIDGQIDKVEDAVIRFEADLDNIKKSQDQLEKTQDQLLNEQRAAVQAVLKGIKELKEKINE